MRSWGKEPENVAEALAFYTARMREDAPAEFLTDYMAFCWQACEPGMAAAADLKDEVFTEAAERLQNLLAQARQDRYRWTALDFWRRYIEWADLALDLSVEDCREFMFKNPGYLDPAFFVFLATDGREMRSEAMLLLSSYSNSSHMRSTYVRSVIESRLRSESLLGQACTEFGEASGATSDEFRKSGG